MTQGVQFSSLLSLLSLLLISECSAADVPPPPPHCVRLAQPPPPPPRAVRLFADKGFVEEAPHSALRVKFHDLMITGDPKSVTPETARSLIPASIQEMDGSLIRISGFMYPPNVETDLPGFMLISASFFRSLDLHFGRNIGLDKKIGVRMKVGTTTDYIEGRPFDVVGRLKAFPRFHAGNLEFLYMIEDAEVIEQ